MSPMMPRAVVAEGITPSHLILGPHTITSVNGSVAPVDLGANALGIIRIAEFVLTVVDFDGGLPSAGISFSLTSWHDAAGTDASGISAGWLSLVPSSFISPVVPAMLRATGGSARYLQAQWEWGIGRGASASATFHVNLTYF